MGEEVKEIAIEVKEEAKVDVEAEANKKYGNIFFQTNRKNKNKKASPGPEKYKAARDNTISKESSTAMWGMNSSNQLERTHYASPTPVAKQLMFENDDACILRTGDLLRLCGACHTPADMAAKHPTLLPLKMTISEDLQEFG